MKLKQLFENSNSQFLQTRDEIEAWLNKYGINDYHIRDDLSVDVNEDIAFLWDVGDFVDFIEFPIQFGTVNGNFYCDGIGLINLKGCPREVDGDFDCSRNNLKTLEGGPREVGGFFDCSNNSQLKSLKGAPKDIGKHFWCIQNKLETLEGAPKFVGGDFWCANNPYLKSLDGIGNVAGQIYSDIK